jgi:molybdopterin biosynthesis enzyme MoaB
MTDRAIHDLTIDDTAWMRTGDDDDHLTAVLVINRTYHHVDAIRVIENDDGIQVAASSACENTLDALFTLGGDGPFATVTLRGGTYVLVVIPFQ